MSSPSPSMVRAPQQQPPRLPCGVDAGEYVFASSSVYLDRSNSNDEMRDCPGEMGSEDAVDEEDDDQSDGLPPTREKVSVRARILHSECWLISFKNLGRYMRRWRTASGSRWQSWRE